MNGLGWDLAFEDALKLKKTPYCLTSCWAENQRDLINNTFGIMMKVINKFPGFPLKPNLCNLNNNNYLVSFNTESSTACFYKLI